MQLDAVAKLKQNANQSSPQAVKRDDATHASIASSTFHLDALRNYNHSNRQSIHVTTDQSHPKTSSKQYMEGKR